MIYGIINSLHYKDFIPTLIDPVDLRAILLNMLNTVPTYLSLPIDPNTNI